MRDVAVQNVSNDRMLDYLFQRCPYEQFESLKRIESKAVESVGFLGKMFHWLTGERPERKESSPEYYHHE